MNAPGPELPPDAAARALDVVEFLAKAAGFLGILWAFIAKVGKPLLDWNQRRRAEIIRAALKKELACISQFPAIDQKLDLALARQDQVFDELDLFVNVVADLRDRTDEINDLLDEGPYASRDRRKHPERRRIADDALDELQGRLKSRRRREDQVKPVEP